MEHVLVTAMVGTMGEGVGASAGVMILETVAVTGTPTVRRIAKDPWFPEPSHLRLKIVRAVS